MFFLISWLFHMSPARLAYVALRRQTVAASPSSPSSLNALSERAHDGRLEALGRVDLLDERHKKDLLITLLLKKL